MSLLVSDDAGCRKLNYVFHQRSRTAGSLPHSHNSSEPMDTMGFFFSYPVLSADSLGCSDIT